MNPELHPRGGFPETRPSAILSLASDEREERSKGLSYVAENYWNAIHQYLCLRYQMASDEAADLVQSFFASFIDRDLGKRFNPDRARFRTYLRTCIDSLVSNQIRHETAQKRNPGTPVLSLDADASEQSSAEATFDHELKRQLIQSAVDDLKVHCESTARDIDFSLFADYDLVEDVEQRATYAALAERYSLPTATVTNRLASVRRRFRQLLLERLRSMTASEDEFREEAQFLFGVIIP